PSGKLPLCGVPGEAYRPRRHLLSPRGEGGRLCRGRSMRRSSLRGKVLLGFVLVVVAGLGAVAWLERQTLLTWFYLHNLSQAGEADREAWAARVAGLDEAAVPGLLGCLGRDEPRACGNACLALDRLGQRWRDHGTRWPDLAARLVEAFPRCSGT